MLQLFLEEISLFNISPEGNSVCVGRGEQGLIFQRIMVLVLINLYDFYEITLTITVIFSINLLILITNAVEMRQVSELK